MNGVGTYGLPGVSRRPTGGGTNLLAMGAGEAGAGLGMIGDAAQQETDRNRTNDQLQQQAQAGNAQLGATAGSIAGGMVGGPVGAAVGGLIGSLMSGLF